MHELHGTQRLEVARRAISDLVSGTTLDSNSIELKMSKVC